MAKQELNRNVIGILTIAVMTLVIGTVGVASYSYGKRDPALLAQKAQEAEKAGDIQRAKDLYIRAFRAGLDPKYMMEASRCAHQEGEFGEAIQFLRLAQAQAPGNPEPTIALLEKYWVLRILGWTDWNAMREAADKLLELEPNNVLALVVRADALNGMRDQDPDNIQKCEESLAKARGLAPDDPRLAVVEAMGHIRRGVESVRKSPNMPVDEARKKIVDSRLAAAAALQKALEKNPKNETLITNLADLLRSVEKPGEARNVLEAGVVQTPDSALVHHALAQLLLTELMTVKAEGPVEERKTLAHAGLEHARRAIELDKALFEGYATVAQFQQLGAQLDGSLDSDRIGVTKKVLDNFVKAQDDTLKLKSLRATVGAQAKATMIASGFDLARGLYNTGRNAEEKNAAMDYARRFEADMKRQFPEAIFQPLMEAWQHQISGDETAAFQAYQRAEERAGSENTIYRRQIKEQLALLKMRDAPGLALRYANEAIDLFNEIGLPVPKRMVIAKAQLMNSLDRAKDTIAFLDSVDPHFPDDFELATLRARALALLGEKDQSVKLLEGREGPQAEYEEAKLLAFRGEYAPAFAKVSAYLQDRPTELEALRLLAQISDRGQMKEQGLKVLDELAAKVSDDAKRLGIETFRVVLGVSDPTEREKRMLELLAKIPDPCQRVSETLNFHLSNRNYDKAGALLPEFLKCRGDKDVAALQTGFELNLANNKIDAAEALLVQLSKLNADRAGGATFRGLLKVSKGDTPGAITEFRAAERDLPTDVPLKVRIADLLRRSSPPQYDDAMAVLKTALEMDPRDFDANRLAYVISEQMGRANEGIEFLERAAAVNPADPFIKERIRLVDESKDPKKGIAWREPLRKERPDDVENLLRLAELYQKTGEPAKADECMAAAVTAGPNSMQVVLAAARYYSLQKNREAGEKIIRQFVSTATGGNRLEGQITLGKFFETLGDPASAAVAYQEAEKKIDEWIKDDAAMKARGRVVVNIALADFYARQKQLPAVIDGYRAALASVRPEMGNVAPEMRQKLVRALMANGQFGDAEKEIDGYVRDYPKDYRGNMMKAEWILRQRNDEESLNKARELLSLVLQGKPDDVWSLFARAKILASQRRLKESQADLVRVKSIDPKAFDYEVRVELARVLESMENYTLAEAELKSIADERPTNLESGQAVINLLLRTDQASKAEQYCNSRIAKTPNEAFWHYQLGRLMARRGEAAAAIIPLTKSLELSNGRNPNVVEEWAAAMVASGRERDVISAAQKFNPEAVTPRVMVAVASAHARARQTREALDLCKRAIEAAAGEPLDVLEQVVRKATACLGQNDLLTALREISKALPADAEVGSKLRLEIILARTLMQQPGPDAMKEAEAITDEVVKNAPPRLRQLFSSALHTKGLCRDLAGDYPEALKYYERAVQADQDDATVLNNIAFLLADKLDRPVDGLPYIEKAARITPLNSNLLDTLGFVHFRLGNLSRAESALLEAVRIDSKAPPPHLHLGQIYAKQGRIGDARSRFQKVLDLTQDDKASKHRKAAEEEMQKLGK